jgi:predicted site-specific integrase-resolvase
MNTEKRLLTIAETAEMLRVCQRTVFYYIEQGKLKPVKLGGIKKTGKNLIPVEQIETLLKQRR